MTPELGQIVAGWPLAASIAVTATAGGLRAGRRRSALNEALHELRRPLQALVLATPGPDRDETVDIGSSAQMAAAALERLDREINGAGEEPPRSPISVLPLLGSAVARWKAAAALAGGSLELRWQAGAATVHGDRCGLAQAFDNLIVNAIEHGGPEIVAEARLGDGRLWVTIADSGRASRPSSRRESPAESIARFVGRRRRGHGLRVVRRTATAHGGSFSLRRSERRTAALLVLPLRGDETGTAA